MCSVRNRWLNRLRHKLQSCRIKDYFDFQSQLCSSLIAFHRERFKLLTRFFFSDYNHYWATRRIAFFFDLSIETNASAIFHFVSLRYLTTFLLRFLTVKKKKKISFLKFLNPRWLTRNLISTFLFWRIP